MNDQNKSLLVLTCSQVLRAEQRRSVQEVLNPLADSMGMKAIALDGGMDIGIHSDIKPLIEAQLAEQKKTNELLLMLIQAMAEDEGMEDQMPSAYMDGTPIG